MLFYPEPMARLIEEFKHLPGIGPKTAQRLAFYVLSMDKEKVNSLAMSLVEAKELMHMCSICCNITDVTPCNICSDSSRDNTVICVVQKPEDVIAMEKTREFKGVYHVLGGAISPLDGIGPNEINLKQLLDRVKENEIKEVIVATNPNIEGETTAIYISKVLKNIVPKVTRIARGLPVGGDLEYADEITLAKALEGRRDI